LVFQMGQPRIWMSMSRDGLLPKAFSRIHPKYHTPSFATIVVGFVVAVPSLFMNLTIVTDLCSIGTLFAFVLVCAGVLVLQDKPGINRKFKIPYVNAKYVVPPISVILLLLAFTMYRTEAKNFLINAPRIQNPVNFVTSLDRQELKVVERQIITDEQRNNLITKNIDKEAYLNKLKPIEYKSFVDRARVNPEKKYEHGLSLFKHKIPMWIFFVLCASICYYCIKKNLSLIPVLGLLSCLYMMCELGISNWLGFGIWLVIGLVVYFLYGFKHSKLNLPQEIA
jgi:APA family basic amino acid/polyamine antiporter